MRWPWAQFRATPWLRSTTPLSCGRRGGFQITPMPKPINHRANGVGRSPHDPQGLPLSTRTDAGRPQRLKQRRSSACTIPEGTWPK